MATLKQIQDDAAFCRACEAANLKARKACDRAHERLHRLESREIARHTKAMQKINDERRAIYRDVYSPIYDPLEEAAYVDARDRIDAAAQRA